MPIKGQPISPGPLASPHQFNLAGYRYLKIYILRIQKIEMTKLLVISYNACPLLIYQFLRDLQLLFY